MATDGCLAIPEIVGLICKHVYLDGFQYPLDPPLVTGRTKATAATSLAALARVNRLFYAEAQPYLYADVSIGLPSSFESFLGTVGVLQQHDSNPDMTDGRDVRGRQSFEERMGILTPPDSRETSRERDCPPDVNFFMPISVTQASTSSSTPQFATPWRDENPGLEVRSITFERFRSHGLRRTVKESSRQRFVTSERLLQILRGTRGPGKLYEDLGHGGPSSTRTRSRGRLAALGLTEYIDSSLNLEVMEEILLRGGLARRSHPDILVGGNLALATVPIERLDFCGCVSRTFIESVEGLSAKYNLSAGADVAASTHTAPLEETVFPHVKRLGLHNVLFNAQLFNNFVMSFPNLTHLDLGNTRASPALLAHLGMSKTIRLQSLSLAKCQMLTSQSIHDFLCCSEPNVLGNLSELSLYFDGTLAISLTRNHLKDILEDSLPFKSGRLRYLDLSTCPLDDTLLQESFPLQPSLLDLGLGNCPSISWKVLSTFLSEKASNVEVLDIRGSCRVPVMPTSPTRVARRNDFLLNAIMGLHQYLISPAGLPPKTHLRVIELEEKVLDAIDAAGSNADWRVCFGKGYRGWYVNCTVDVDISPQGERVQKRLEKGDVRRDELFELARKSKNGGYNLGWHARKMAILDDNGMLGREHGLYSFHSFS